MSSLNSALRYLGTYAVLLKHFAQSRGWRFGMMLAAVIANAVLHPVPFLLLAELLRSAQAGASEVTLGWHWLTITLKPDTAVLAVFLIGSASVLFSYGVGRLVNAETMAWQGQLFWQLTGGLTRIARWDRVVDLGVQLRPGPLANRIDAAVRAAFPIGRLIETGMRDAMMVLVLAGVLLWQDPRDMVVLGFLSLLFLPAYGVAIARLVRMQAKSNAGLNRLRPPVTGLISGDVMRRPGQAIDEAATPAATTQTLAQAYGSQSILLNEQNAVTVVAGVHVFAAFYGVYLSEGLSLMALPASKLAFFFFLVLMLRSLISLVGLMSRLSRGYERLGLLRTLLFPAAKRAGTGADVAFGVSPADGSTKSTIQAGETMVLLAPDMRFGFQLLALANGLSPTFAPDGRTRHIPLLGEEEVATLLAGGSIEGAPERLRLPPAGIVALRPEPLDLSKTPVVALTTTAWQSLVRSKRKAEVNAGRVLVIAVASWRIPLLAPKEAVIAVSDGRRLVAVGSREAVAPAIATLVAGTVSAKAALDDEDALVEE